MEAERFIKENLYKDVDDNEISIGLIEQINGLPRTRADVYKDYLMATKETNVAYVFQATKINEDKSAYLLFEKRSPEDMVIKKFTKLSKAYENIRFRERYLIDISTEIKLFDINVKQFEDANAININMYAEPVKSKNSDKYYAFNIYFDEELIAREVANIYCLDIDNVIGDKVIKNVI